MPDEVQIYDLQFEPCGCWSGKITDVPSGRYVVRCDEHAEPWVRAPEEMRARVNARLAEERGVA